MKTLINIIRYPLTGLISLIWIFHSCAEPVKSESKADTEIVHTPKSDFPRHDTIFTIDAGSGKLQVKLLFSKAKESKGTILALPGWSFPFSHWCDSTTICELATASGYHLVMPTIGKSIYSHHIYPETRSDWKNELTLSWFNDNFFPFMRDSFDLLLPDSSNFLLGISTGARGALIFGEEWDDTFKGIALLSGDYDQEKFSDDNLYRGFFGPITRFPERYSGEENPVNNLERINFPVYIVHGSMDKVVDPGHSRHLYTILRQMKSGIPVTYNEVEGAGHDYRFWNSQMTNVIDFFNSIQ